MSYTICYWDSETKSQKERPATPEEVAEIDERKLPQPTPVPQVLTARQAKLILLQNGLLDDVDAAVSQAARATQIEWEYAQEVSRTWPTLVAMAAALGMTSDQLDELFIEGAKL